MKQHLVAFWKPSLVALFLVLFLSFIPLLLPVASGHVSASPAAHPPATPTPAPTPPRGTHWLLENYAQSTCLVQENPAVEMVTYYAIWINGRWTHSITGSITNTPVGTQTWSFYNPIPPGSSDGIGSLADIAVQIPSNTPLGIYTLQLTATDGKLHQSVPVTLSVQTSCGHY